MAKQHPAPPPSQPSKASRRVLILADGDKGAVRELLGELQAWLERHGMECELETDLLHWCAALDREALKRKALARCGYELVVVLGGDGALLAAVRGFRDAPVPTLGINFGRVGFLASTPATRWQETLEGVLAGRGVVEERLRLQAAVPSKQGPIACVALNEIVVTRGAHQGMLSLTLHVDGLFVTQYRADGLIVATPSGSTAYSLSAGGPILSTGVQGLVITPISPQGLSNRPLVVPADASLAITVDTASGVTTMVVDGQAFYSLHQGDRVELMRHAQTYPLYVMPGLDPYRRLRSRLGWRGSLEPSGETEAD